jgi:hypothetical protein
MLARNTPSFMFPHEYHNYSPEDLESMRQAFMRACGENPLAAQTEAQRSCLAKAMVNIYQRHLSQSELVAAAIRLVR